MIANRLSIVVKTNRVRMS